MRLPAVFGSPFPSNRYYLRQLRIYGGNALYAGLTPMHRLFHAYARNRYQTLGDWKAPAARGSGMKALALEPRERDRET